MDESTNSGVAAGASPAAEASPAPASPDTGGSQGAPPSGGAQGTPGTDLGTSAAPPEVAQNDSSADAGAEDSLANFTDEELAAVPDQWRDRFGSLHKGYKSLEADHKTLKEQYQPLSEFGEVGTIKSSLELLDGLYGYAQDAEGNPIYDEATGLPKESTTGFISRLAEGSPALVDRLFDDLWQFRGGDGKTFAQSMFQRLGLDPSRLSDYRELTQNPQKSVATSSGVISSDELANIPESFHDVYKQLSFADRYLAQQMDDTQLESFLADKQELFETRKFREDYQKSQAEQAQQAEQQFWQGVDKTFGEYAGQLRQDGLNSIVKNLSSQVTFSADPVTNSVQQSAVMAITANLLNPDLRFAAQGALEALGIKLDPSFDESLTALNQQAYRYIQLKSVAGNPAMAKHRNDAAMAKAQAETKRLYDMTMAKFNGIALKIAKVITGSNQGLREVEKSQLENGGRPTVGNGALPGSGGGARPALKAKPFTVEALEELRQQRAGQ